MKDFLNQVERLVMAVDCTMENTMDYKKLGYVGFTIRHNGNKNNDAQIEIMIGKKSTKISTGLCIERVHNEFTSPEEFYQYEQEMHSFKVFCNFFESVDLSVLDWSK